MQAPQKQTTLDALFRRTTSQTLERTAGGRVGPASGKRSRSSSRSPPRPRSPGGSGWLSRLITEPQWKAALGPVLQDPTWRQSLLPTIEKFLDSEQHRGATVLPPRPFIFTALNRTPFHSVKVVLLGQDPYHDIGQAHGLCFSVQPGVKVPPSLQNMYKELEKDVEGFKTPSHGYLQSWADQGMLMLNATLTVRAHEANSHSKCGWQSFTDEVIVRLSSQSKHGIVFLLWGNFAKSKKKLIDQSRHVIIESAHPSPLSARYWHGCRCFSQCNAALSR